MTQLSDKQDILVELAEIKGKIDYLIKIIEGNGDEGLVSKVDSLEKWREIQKGRSIENERNMLSKRYVIGLWLGNGLVWTILAILFYFLK